jgi:hypothetical protein
MFRSHIKKMEEAIKNYECIELKSMELAKDKTQL